MENPLIPTRKNILNAAVAQVDEPAIVLEQVWKVEAQTGYDSNDFPRNLPHEKKRTNKYLAIRTLSGKGVLQMEDSATINLLADTVIILDSNRRYRYYCKNSDWSLIGFLFDAEDPSHITLNELQYARVTETERRIHDDCYTFISGSYHQALYSQHLFKSLLAFWHMENESTSLKRVNVENTLDFIINKLSFKVTVAQIAEMLNMSAQRLRRIFMRHIGVSPKQYINEKRLKAAKEMLETTDMAVYEIAEHCGFHDTTHFGRCFRERFGRSPREFRNKT